MVFTCPVNTYFQTSAGLKSTLKIKCFKGDIEFYAPEKEENGNKIRGCYEGKQFCYEFGNLRIVKI